MRTPKQKRTFRTAMINMMKDERLQNDLLKALFEKAVNGDIRAFEVIRDLIGEKGKTETEDSIHKIKIEIVEPKEKVYAQTSQELSGENQNSES